MVCNHNQQVEANFDLDLLEGQRLQDTQTQPVILVQETFSPKALRFSPKRAALRATRPAPIITYGFEVLVQDVMEAITTLPDSMVNMSSPETVTSLPIGRLKVSSISLRKACFTVLSAQRSPVALWPGNRWYDGRHIKVQACLCRWAIVVAAPETVFLCVCFYQCDADLRHDPLCAGSEVFRHRLGRNHMSRRIPVPCCRWSHGQPMADGSNLHRRIQRTFQLRLWRAAIQQLSAQGRYAVVPSLGLPVVRSRQLQGSALRWLTQALLPQPQYRQHPNQERSPLTMVVWLSVPTKVSG